MASHGALFTASKGSAHVITNPRSGNRFSNSLATADDRAYGGSRSKTTTGAPDEAITSVILSIPSDGSMPLDRRFRRCRTCDMSWITSGFHRTNATSIFRFMAFDGASEGIPKAIRKIADISGFSRLDELDAYSVADQVRSRLNAQLAHDFVFMRFCRPRRNSHQSGCFLHRFSFSEKLQDFALPGCERSIASLLFRTGRHEHRNQIARKQRSDIRRPLCNRVNRLNKLPRIAHLEDKS